MNDDADGWSVGDDIRSDSTNRYTGGDCDSTRSESYLESEIGKSSTEQYRDSPFVRR